MSRGQPRQFYRIDTLPNRWFIDGKTAKAEAIKAAAADRREIRLYRSMIATDKGGLLALLNAGHAIILSNQTLFIARAPKDAAS